MKDEPSPMEATTHGSGQSVNINLGDGWKQFQIILIALLIALVFSCTLSLVAYHEAQEAKTQSEMWAFWGQRVQANMQARGVDMPPIPKASH